MSTKLELSRITIDLPKADHKKLKALAAVLGKSMREVVMESIKEHFDKVVVPNKKTMKAIGDVEKKKGMVKVKNADDLFKKLGI